jgi:ribonuclease HI
VAAAGSLMNLQDALHAEVMACFEALNLVICFGINHVIVETDSEQLVQALKDDELDNGMNAAVIREVRNLFSLQFDVTKVVYCHRACNSLM